MDSCPAVSESSEAGAPALSPERMLEIAVAKILAEVADRIEVRMTFLRDSEDMTPQAAFSDALWVITDVIRDVSRQS